jgi:tol-pal system protein YbgF
MAPARVPVRAMLARAGALGLGIALASPAAVWAQVPVEDASFQRPDEQVEVATPADEDSSAGALGTLFYQLQTLQEELRNLQGLVEEQNHRIERLEREQRERYIDVDQRLLALKGAAVAGADAATTDDALGIAATAGGGSATEADAYNSAFQIIQDARGLVPSEQGAEYERAIAGFTALIADYPNGVYTPNAFYWVGELQLSNNELELARQAFVQVVTLFPQHAKTPDALYKLGVTYHRLEDSARALEYLDRVIDDFPSHTAAGLATKYAAELR